MAHIELSLEPIDIEPSGPLAARALDSGHISAWLEAVGQAEEPCLLLDAGGIVMGASPPCVRILGAESAEELVGRGLLEDVVDLVDFTAARERLLDAQLERIPPLLALASGALARGLLRLRTGDTISTLDAIATPLRIGGKLVGSLTFFHRI